MARYAQKGFFKATDLESIHQAISQLGFQGEHLEKLHQGIEAFIHSRVQKPDRLAEISRDPGATREFDALLGEAQQQSAVPPRPKGFRINFGQGIEYGDVYTPTSPRDIPIHRDDCLINLGAVLDIFERAFTNDLMNGIADNDLGQDRLWGRYYGIHALVQSVEPVWELVRLSQGFLDGTQNEREELHTLVMAHGGRPPEPLPRPFPDGLPFPRNRPWGEFDFCRAQAEGDLGGRVRAICGPIFPRIGAVHNLSRPDLETGGRACELNVIEIAHSLGILPWAEVLFPYHTYDEHALPPLDHARSEIALLANVRVELIPYEGLRRSEPYLVVRVDTTMRWGGIPALDDGLIRVTVPPTMVLDAENDLITQGIKFNDREIFVRFPCPDSGRLPLEARFWLNILPPPRVLRLSLNGPVVACEPVRASWVTQGMDYIEIRALPDHPWQRFDFSDGSRYRPRSDGVVLNTDGWFDVFVENIRLEARGAGTCGDANVLRSSYEVFYRLSAAADRSALPVEEEAAVTVSLPTCTRAWPAGVRIQAEQSGRGIFELPASINIVGGSQSVLFRLRSLEAGVVDLHFLGNHLLESTLTLRITHDVPPVPLEDQAVRCDSISLEPIPDPAAPSQRFKNWHGNIRRVLPTIRPSTREDLVNTVLFAESLADHLPENQRMTVGVKGTGWSYTECVVASDTELLIETDDLNRILDEFREEEVETHPNQGVISYALRADRRREARYLLYVEAGIKLHRLNCELNDRGLAMPTLGGSRGQSLAGVMSTGVHGSDVDLPPVADAVRAIHLVGPGGLEWWIEPESDSLTNPVRMAHLRQVEGFCPSMQIVYNDDLFNACLVSIGAAGIIYAVVIEAVDAFHLASFTDDVPWDTVDEYVQRAVIDRVGLEPASLPPKFIELIVNPVNRRCRRTERSEALLMPCVPDGDSESGGGLDVGQALLVALGVTAPLPVPGVEGGVLPILAGTVIGYLVTAMTTYITRKWAEINSWLGVPVYGLIRASEIMVNELEPVVDMFDLLSALISGISDEEDYARALPPLINLLWRIGNIFGEGRIIVEQMQALTIDGQRPITLTSKVGKSYMILTDQPDCLECVDGVNIPGTRRSGDQTHSSIQKLIASYEYALPADRVVEFVDRILRFFDRLHFSEDAFVLTISIRFTSQTRALIGMQQFPRTAHVELFTVAGLRGNASFVPFLDELTREFRAVPHWGQLHSERSDFAGLFGDRLTAWQAAIARIAGSSEKRDLFWNSFLLRRGLVPLE
jgi:FAD/FMN-containing dehydrogenase